MVDHLKEAKFYAHAADGLDVKPGPAQVVTQLAIAHGIIALVERVDKVIEGALLAPTSEADKDAAGWEHVDDNLL